MPKYLVAHDLGTTGNKATLFTAEGELVKSTVATYDTHYFNSNWAEQNPADWWAAVSGSSRKLLGGIDPGDVAAVSFSGQMMGCLCVDKNGSPLRPHIIWADMRAVREQQYILERMDAHDFYRIAGHRASASYSLAKLLWIKNNEPDVFRGTYKVLNAKDYIVYKMTGRFLTDYSDATGTNAFDIGKYEWSGEILERVGIDAALFPRAEESVYVAGGLIAAAAADCGMAAGTPVVVGAGDGIAACVGAGSVREGVTYNCLGSSSWIATTAREPILDEHMRTFNWAHMVRGLVSPCGTMQTAGASYAWMKKELCAYETHTAEAEGKNAYDVINAEIASSPVGANGVLFLPYLLGERSPRWNPNAKGVFVGMNMENTRADMLRGVVEGVAMNLKLIFDIMNANVDISEINVIGGLSKSPVFNQILADVLGVDVLPLNYVEEATSIGAAVAAGVGVGALDGLGDVRKFTRTAGRFMPREESHAYYKKALRVFDRVYDALGKSFEEVEELKRIIPCD